MVQFNAREKEIIIKLVYYGPGLSGKTTNLRYIHKITDPGRETKLISLNTEKDRTLFFDLLPYDLGHIKGMKIKLQLYTVPGQSKYSSTRKAVLKGADGVVFVADSQRYMMTQNIENLKDMAENLKEHKLDIETIPLVMQYNKRDLPKILTLNELNNILNKRNCPNYEAIAINGEGVFETLTSVLYATADYVLKEFEIPVISDDASNIKKLITKNLGRFSKTSIEESITEPVMEKAADRQKEAGKQKIEQIPTEPSLQFNLEDPLSVLDRLEKAYLDKEKGTKDYEENVDTDELILEPELAEDDEGEKADEGIDRELFEKAVDSNLQISQLYVQVDEITRKLNEKVKEVNVLNQVALLMASNEDLTEILKNIFKLALEARNLHHGSLLIPRKDGYKQMIAVGFPCDPLLSIRNSNDVSALDKLALSKSIITANIINRSGLDETEMDKDEIFRIMEEKNIDSFILTPMISKGIMHGVLNFYRVNSPFEFSAEDTEFLQSLAIQAALVIENTKLKHRSETSGQNDSSRKIQNLHRLMIVFQKRLQANMKVLDELSNHFASSNDTKTELMLKNEKDQNSKILKSIAEIIKNT